MQKYDLKQLNNEGLLECVWCDILPSSCRICAHDRLRKHRMDDKESKGSAAHQGLGVRVERIIQVGDWRRGCLWLLISGKNIKNIIYPKILIIPKNPWNTSTFAGFQIDFTTNLLLLTDCALICRNILRAWNNPIQTRRTGGAARRQSHNFI